MRGTLILYKVVASLIEWDCPLEVLISFPLYTCQLYSYTKALQQAYKTSYSIAYNY